MSTEGAADQTEYVPEKVKKAEKKLEENPYDLDAWSILIREAQNQPIDKARKTYERLVSQFPSSGRFWKLFIEAEIKLYISSLKLCPITDSPKVLVVLLANNQGCPAQVLEGDCPRNC